MNPTLIIPKETYKFSVKKTIESQTPKPAEGTDYYRADKFDCTVAFEIHVPGFEDEAELDIKLRASEAIKADGDMECLGVMMKEKNGRVCLDMDGKPFDRDAWIKQKTDELKIIRKEKPLTEFLDIELED